MQFPNAYKGVKKIYLAELLMLAVAVLGIAIVVILVAGGMAADGNIDRLNLTEEQAAIVAGLGLAVSLLMIIGFILMLVGVINAKKDDSNFRIALYAILLGILFAVINALLSKQYPVIERWLSLATSICSLFSTYFILSGIGSLAERMGDAPVKALADKARNVLCFTFSASYILKLIQGFLNNSTFSQIINLVGLVLEIVSYIYFLIVLAKGRKMLAG
jgi:hypothetical protein